MVFVFAAKKGADLMTKKRAVKERLILRNPTEDCIAPKVQKFEMQILQPEHIKTYLDAADKRGTAAHILSGTGQRTAQG